jgi:nicotinamide riboside kinase
MCNKYVFLGSHGTGKSSAASHLASILKRKDPSKNIGTIPENVREVTSMVGGKINTSDYQHLCMIDRIHRELRLQPLYHTLVIDRSALDPLVYGMSYQLKLKSEYFSLALNHMSSYDKVFFVRPNHYEDLIADDGFRDTDAVMRAEVDKQFEKMLGLWGGEYTELKTKEIFTFDYLKVIGE